MSTRRLLARRNSQSTIQHSATSTPHSQIPKEGAKIVIPSRCPGPMALEPAGTVAWQVTAVPQTHCSPLHRCEQESAEHRHMFSGTL